MGMPERIWAEPWPGRFASREWALTRGYKAAGRIEYIRADLAVLATTHQRTLEALSEVLQEARAEFLYRCPDPQMRIEKLKEEARRLARVVAKIDAALAKIKEAT